MTAETFSQEISNMAQILLEIGLHPSVVRRRLAERGLHWAYQYRTASGGAPQGMRQRLRNLRRQGLGLCSACHERPYTLGSTVNVCGDCLLKRWSGQAPTMDCQSIAG